MWRDIRSTSMLQNAEIPRSLYAVSISHFTPACCMRRSSCFHSLGTSRPSSSSNSFSLRWSRADNLCMSSWSQSCLSMSAWTPIHNNSGTATLQSLHELQNPSIARHQRMLMHSPEDLTICLDSHICSTTSQEYGTT